MCLVHRRLGVRRGDDPVARGEVGGAVRLAEDAVELGATHRAGALGHATTGLAHDDLSLEIALRLHFTQYALWVSAMVASLRFCFGFAGTGGRHRARCVTDTLRQSDADLSSAAAFALRNGRTR